MIALRAAPVGAQQVVFDPTNFAQNVQTAANTLQQVANQIQSLQNQALMLENQARNLTSLNASSVGQFDASVARIGTLMNQAEGILYNVAQVQAQYPRSYPASYGGASNAQMMADAQTRWQNALSSFGQAMQIQAEIVQNLPSDQSAADGLVGQSQGAVGILQASQAGNQLVALQIEQMGRLQALLAAQGRAQALEQARSAVAQAQAQAQYANFLQPVASEAPAPVAMFHN
jgi:P-type conjugative transfer protein TrbJ